MFHTVTHARSAATAHRAAQVAPSSFSEADNSVEVTWTTGAPVLRYGLFVGGYTETLEVTPQAIRLDRLNAGAAVLDSHDQFRLSSLIGSVVPGSARIEGGEGRCRMRLADTPDAADSIAKIRAGHLRSVSVGYIVHTYEHHPSDDRDEPDELRAIDWEPVEISLVSVPADPGCNLRIKESDMTRIISAGSNRTPPAILNRAGLEPAPQQAEGGRAADPVDDRRERAPQRRGRGVTEARIRELCSRTDDLSRSFERDLLADHDEEPLSERELLARISDELLRVRERPVIDTRRSDVGTFDRGHETRSAFADALYARLSGGEAPETAREYQGATMVDMARALLEQRGERVRWMRPAAVVDQLARSGMHTTSDFQHIIANAGRRYLIDAFSQIQSPLKILARKRDFPDFKVRYGIQAEGNLDLLVVPENGEFKSGTFTTAANGMKLSTYGRIFPITRQMLVNDDLGVFADMARFWARAGSELEANYLVGMIASNGVVMGEDNKTLYHADHRNILPAAPITPDSLSLARQQLRSQKNRDGATAANIVPKYLVVGAEKETEAEAVLTQLNAGSLADVNVFGGKLELVVDARLVGKSWRLFADPALSPVLEYGNLEGQDGLFTDAKVGFEVDGVQFKARTDLGAGAIDWRGTVMNPGA